MAKDSMIIYRSIAEALSELPSDEYKTMMSAVFGYAFDDILPEFGDAACRMAWRLIKPQLDACVRKYQAQVDNGQKGGRPKTQQNPTKPNENPNKPNGNPTETLNDKCKMINDKCINKSSHGLIDTRARVREEDDDFDDGWDPDKMITTTDGKQIRLGDVHFGKTIKQIKAQGG